MSAFRVDIDGTLLEVDDLLELCRLARTGRLRRRDRVSRAGGAWVAASSMPELAREFKVDIWDAWEDLDEDPVEPAIEVAQEPEPPALPVETRPELSDMREKLARMVREEEAALQAAQDEEEREAAILAEELARLEREATGDPPSEPGLFTDADLEPLEDAFDGEPAPTDEVVSPRPAPPGALGKTIVPRRVVPMPTTRQLARPRAGAVQPERLEVAELPELAVEPLAPEPMGQVIAFPAHHVPPPTRSITIPPSDTLPPPPTRQDLVPVSAPRRPNRPPVPTRWWMMGAFVVLFAAGTALAAWYVRSLATWTPTAPTTRVHRPADDLVRTEVLPEVDPALPEVAPVEPVTAPPAEDPALAQSKAMADELRERLGTRAIDLDGTAERLEDVLFTDLARVASPRKVKAEVIQWTEGEAPVPEVVSLTFYVNSHGDVARELTAVGLVAGRVINQHDLQVRKLEAYLVDGDGTTRGRDLDPAAALGLYRGRVDPVTFLLPPG